MDRAARILLAGGVVAYPTEAVYGIGCLPLERAAVAHILALKRRSWRKGLIVIAADFADLEKFVTLPSGPTRAEVLASWPGPVTWVLAARPGVPDWLTGGRDTLAVRVTDHPIARYLCGRAGDALVSTSANRAGGAPLKTALGVRRQLGHALDAIVVGPVGTSPRPTRIRDGATGRLLRAG